MPTRLSAVSALPANSTSSANVGLQVGLTRDEAYRRLEKFGPNAMPNTALHPLRRADPRILTINGGSSSIKFALFEAGDSLRRILQGGIERIGLPDATLRVRGLNQADNFSRSVTAPDHTVAVGILIDWIEERSGRDAVTAAGHRVVHGGPKYSKPQRITTEMVEELHRLSPFDPEHLPLEIELIEAFR
jgi:acetate kinase